MDGADVRLDAIDSQTGDVKFELTVPASRQQLVNLKRRGTESVCSPGTASPKVEIGVVNNDGFAYLAFSQKDQTLSTGACRPGSVVEPREVTVSYSDRMVLWQIRPDGTHRDTVFEETAGTHSLAQPLPAATPAGAIIPDGLGGVLLAVRRSENVFGGKTPRLPKELVDRLDGEGKLAYKLSLPEFEGPLHDEMVLGEKNLGFATRGGTLIAFDVELGKELWRWQSSSPEIEAFAALADGSCLVQTESALVAVADSTNSKVVAEGRGMLDWQGRLYIQHKQP